MIVSPYCRRLHEFKEADTASAADVFPYTPEGWADCLRAIVETIKGNIAAANAEIAQRQADIRNYEAEVARIKKHLTKLK